jgi:hypothetical protein
MAQIDNRYVHPAQGTRADTSVTVDEGLRAHMLRVYNYLGAGIGLAAVLAYAVYSLSVTTDPALATATMRNGVKLTAFGQALFGSPLIMVLKFAPLILLLGLAFMGHKLSAAGTQLAYWGLVALIGAGGATWFIQFKLGSIAQVFAITAMAFAALSLWGYTTKRDLTGMGSFLIMGLVGIILAGLANLWFQSGALHFAITVMGVGIFAGLTAYDTQRLKDEYYYVQGDAAAMSKAASWGALSLFLDFVNLFQMLLSLLGNRE